MYQKSLIRTKESMLHSHLQTLRIVIDEYTFDKKKAPQTLDDLVAEGYLRAVPIDPITGNDELAHDQGRLPHARWTRPSRGSSMSAACRTRSAWRVLPTQSGETES